jgi:hypothetical protein
MTMEYYIITIAVAAIAWVVGVKMGAHYAVKQIVAEMDK